MAMGRRRFGQSVPSGVCCCARPQLRILLVGGQELLLKGTAISVGRRMRRIRTGLEGFFLGAEFF
jgi:hypothetical protein